MQLGIGQHADVHELGQFGFDQILPIFTLAAKRVQLDAIAVRRCVLVNLVALEAHLVGPMYFISITEMARTLLLRTHVSTFSKALILIHLSAMPVMAQP